jgi:hypothetical protein
MRSRVWREVWRCRVRREGVASVDELHGRNHIGMGWWVDKIGIGVEVRLRLMNFEILIMNICLNE